MKVLNSEAQNKNISGSGKSISLKDKIHQIDNSCMEENLLTAECRHERIVVA